LALSLTSKRFVAVIAAFIGVLFQAQITFACQEMDLTGALDECCCEHTEFEARNSASSPDPEDTCCHYYSSTSLKFEATDTDGEAALIGKTKFSPDKKLIREVDPFVATLPHVELKPRGWTTVVPFSEARDTYLKTLRLRI